MINVDSFYIIVCGWVASNENENENTYDAMTCGYSADQNIKLQFSKMG
jgi:hypothetical protein